MQDDEYKYLKGKIFSLLNIDLSGYKDHQMRRRLDGFMARSQESNVASYCKTLEVNRNLLTKLRDFLTINVSEFFRDSEQYEILRTRVLPELLKRSPRLNIWSAGCSNGSEPYSLAIILSELSPRQKHRILATDLDVGILAQARAGGPYTQADVRQTEGSLLSKYFTTAQDGYWVCNSVKQYVEFKNHNLLRDPFESGFDLVICRNVVIYFSDEAKNGLYRGFHRALKEDGVLFIGGTETMLGSNDIGFERLHNSFHCKRASQRVRSGPPGASATSRR